MPDNHKSFTSTPIMAIDDKGNHLKLEEELHVLSQEITMLTDLANWHIRSDISLLREVSYHDNVKAAKAGERLGIYLPQEIKNNRKNPSRLEHLYRDMIIRNIRSWRERVNVTDNNSKKYVSQGWKRTADNTRPELSPKISLSAIDHQFATISINDSRDNITLKMTVKDKKVSFIFPFQGDRFKDCNKVTLPDIVVREGKIHFYFTAQYSYQYVPISSRYTVGVDVGVKTYASVVVWDNEYKCIVHSTTLSRRTHSLYNSIFATNRQVKVLQSLGRSDEARAHREANSRKNKELAIISAQEIAEIAYIWDNAAIVFEDLGWVSNTMSHGRWNRGELVRWTDHFHQLNGGRVIKVSAYKTSQLCHQCGSFLSIKNWHDVVCSDHGLMDRDINAAANIAQKPVIKGTVNKIVRTRYRAKRFSHVQVRRSPVSRDSLKYPGRDRTKNSPTRKRGDRKGKSFHIKEVNNQVCSPIHYDDGTVLGDDRFESESLVRTLEKQHEYVVIRQ